MGVPGPAGPDWAIVLLAWAALAVLVGEFVRVLASLVVPLWKGLEPIERVLLDLYLGGAVLYLVASIPWGGFVPLVVDGIPAVATVLLAVLAARAARRAGGWRRLFAPFASLARPAQVTVLASALVLFVVEVWVAVPVATGNTFDSSLFTVYTSLLLQNHTTPMSFAPYASTGILYPQGTTVWFGWAQLLLGLPPARTALLVTPLFLGATPLAGFVLGRRMVGSDRAGLAIALVLAWVGTGTRGIVYGSNDFVLAFPLLLLLVGEAVVWLRSPVLGTRDAVAFGILTGYSAALNPVGAEWLFLALPLVALLAREPFGGHVRRWWTRWGIALAASLLAVVPSLYVLAHGYGSPHLVPGATASVAGSPTGISQSSFVGFIDPFLFRSQDTGLSSVAALRFELAILLAAGLAVLFLVRRDSALGRYLDPLRPFLAGGGAVLIALLGLFWAASSGYGPLVTLTALSNANELSALLFTLYGIIAAIPLALALERFFGWWRRAESAPSATADPAPSRYSGGLPSYALRSVVPMVVVLAIVVPGVVLTPTQLPPTLSQQYHDFGNVTGADFDLLSYAGSHLPAGARVLVAPGSAGEFLPGYCSDIVLLYPMVPGWSTVNASYSRLVDDLPNGTLGPADIDALRTLAVGFVVVTGNSTILWPAFSPTPFLAEPSSFPVLFHEADAYLFAVALPPPATAPAAGTS